MRASDFLAIYGSIWPLRSRHGTSRSTLSSDVASVQSYLAMMFQPGDGLKPASDQLLAYSIANTGGKPVVVTSVGGASAGGSDFLLLQESASAMKHGAALYDNEGASPLTSVLGDH